ncbi:MAG: WXG100 family type VII secretion target [Pseudonocardiaceae bacterium]
MSANPLVAQEEQNTTIYSGIGILDSATQCVEAISSGDWIDIGINTAAASLDTLDLASDPAGALLSYGIGWLIEHVDALSEPLNWLAGNPDAISTHAQTWGNVAHAVSAVRHDYEHTVGSDLTTWQGAAAEAYRTRANDIDHLLDASAIAAEGIRVAVTMAGMIVTAVRDKIRELISDLVSRLISYAAELAATAGLAAPVVAQQAISLIAKWAAKIADLITKLLRTIKALMPLLRHLEGIFDTIKNAMAALPEGTSLAITVFSSAKNSLTTNPSGNSHQPARQSAISHALDG